MSAGFWWMMGAISAVGVTVIMMLVLALVLIKVIIKLSDREHARQSKPTNNLRSTD